MRVMNSDPHPCCPRRSAARQMIVTAFRAGDLVTGKNPAADGRVVQKRDTVLSCPMATWATRIDPQPRRVTAAHATIEQIDFRRNFSKPAIQRFVEQLRRATSASRRSTRTLVRSAASMRADAPPLPGTTAAPSTTASPSFVPTWPYPLKADTSRLIPKITRRAKQRLYGLPCGARPKGRARPEPVLGASVRTIFAADPHSRDGRARRGVVRREHRLRPVRLPQLGHGGDLHVRGLIQGRWASKRRMRSPDMICT